MRVPALLCAACLVGVSNAPATAQATLPSTAFAPSLRAVAPDEVPPSTEWWRTGGPRIRPTDDRTASLLAIGLERSPILRRLAGRVESGSVFAYVGLSKDIDRDLAGSLAFVGDAGPYRYLRVSLNPRLSADSIIVALAHELQHVIEIIESPRVRSESGLASLYLLIGRVSRASGRLAWETDRARQVGDEVRMELKTGAATAVARVDAADGREPR